VDFSPELRATRKCFRSHSFFFIYINDIDYGIERIKILKFADDTKLYRRITSEQDVTKLQEDLATLCKWSKEWLMLFNVNKCKILHLGHG
jgi:ribonuclease P/MRP protein subunit RPP40